MSKKQITLQSRALMRRETVAAYIFLLPFLVFFLGFVVIPMIMCLYNSLFEYGGAGRGDFIGLKNYFDMFRWKSMDGGLVANDPVFWKSMWNTIIIVLVSVPTVTAFSLWVGSAIYRMNTFSRSFFRCIFYLPVVTGTVAVTVVWKWIFNKYNGLLNHVLQSGGIIDENISWLGDERFALACIILILFTTSIGQPIVLYVAALGNVDHSMVEAAQVDGANERQVFWRVKWAQILPTTLYILIITTINSFQCFALIELLTRGGPNYSTMTIMYNIYYTAFDLNNYGYGSAMGIVLALVIALFSAIQFKATSSDD